MERTCFSRMASLLGMIHRRPRSMGRNLPSVGLGSRGPILPRTTGICPPKCQPSILKCSRGSSIPPNLSCKGPLTLCSKQGPCPQIWRTTVQSGDFPLIEDHWMKSRMSHRRMKAKEISAVTRIHLPTRPTHLICGPPPLLARTKMRPALQSLPKHLVSHPLRRWILCLVPSHLRCCPRWTLLDPLCRVQLDPAHTGQVLSVPAPSRAPC
mmetsp:Transcript_113462/g.197055  ORF Transcript_113462/g.197055 Transcript_113462/m.197055 type:complete len:210 (+) Transcript_113462:827-1456(+)